MREESINRFINSRYCLLTMAVVAVALSYFFHIAGTGVQEPPQGISTLPVVFDGPWIVNIALVFTVAVILRVLDKNFAFVREYTVIYVSYFLFAVLVNPDYASGTPAAAAVNIILMLCTLILFGNYQHRERRRIVFLVSFLLSACSLLDYVCLLFFPAFIIGFLQMKIFSFKGFLAMLLGAVTPYWIVLGAGILSFGDLQMPRFDISLDRYMQELDLSDIYRIAFLLIAGTVLGIANMFKLISYRLQLRSYNGFFTFMAIFTTLLMVVDIKNLDTYLMTLNICMAYQTAHFFTIYKLQRRYVLFFLMILANAACSIPEIINFLRL